MSAVKKKCFVVAEYSTRQIGTNKWWKVLEHNLIEDQDQKVLSALEKIDCAKKLDDNGNNLLHYAARADNKIVACRLLEAGCDVNQKNNAGVPPIATAVAYDSHKVLELLLNFGAMFTNEFFEYQFGLLHIATYATAFKCLDVISSTEKEFGVVDKDGWTPLHVAMEFDKCRADPRNIEFVKKIINSGKFPSSSINALCKLGRTALYHASIVGYCSGIQALLDTKAFTKRNITNSLHFAILMYDVNVVHLLLKAGADMNELVITENCNYTILEYACYMGRYKISRVHKKNIDRESRDLFSEMIKGRQTKIVLLLISNGADVKLRSGKFSNLDHAYLSKNTVLMRLLKDNGASLKDSKYPGFIRDILPEIE